jgi:hypothetical protein
MRKLMSLLLIYLGIASSLFANPFYNVVEYGAKGDGKLVNTIFIQQAIDECAAKGGGTVYFPAGKYISGTIFFKSNITLHIDAGAELIASTNIKDYPSKVPALSSYINNYTERSLIYAEKADHIGISGQGKINGQGAWYQTAAYKEFPYKLRPYLIRMIECSNIRIKDITLMDPPMWTQHYLACENLYVDNIHVTNWNSNVNNDGIDLDGCNKVMITNSYFKVEDDAICLKSSLPRPSKDITITNCILSSLCNAIKFGTESVGGFENVTISNCVIIDTKRSGIALESVDGAIMKNITISNIVMKNVHNPLFIRLGKRMRPYQKDAALPPIGTAENIMISNIIATESGSFSDDLLPQLYFNRKSYVNKMAVGCIITGIPGHLIKNVTLRDIQIEFKGGGKKIPNQVPEREDAYPEYYSFGELPAYGLFGRHIDGIKFYNLNFTYRNADTRPAIWLDDVSNATISGLQAQYESETEALIVAERSKRIVIESCHYFTPLKALTSIIQNTSEVVLQHNSLSENTKAYLRDSTVLKKTITQLK